jgi:predicted phage baseplate assembly protein
MALPSPNLDDLRFQRDLVDEARKRIVRYCPEWTDYNLSDPGITLIELFAWMTEQICYRLNRVPEKNYVHFLDMLGVQLLPASSAHTYLTFRLSTPFPINEGDDTVAIVPAGTEVATRSVENEDEVVFTTDEKLIIAPPRLLELRREEEFNRNYLSRLGIEDFFAFNRVAPRVGDTFYLGFAPNDNLRGVILQLYFQCEETQATGIRREDPPLVWECSTGEGGWKRIYLSTTPGERDTTGGLNNPEGNLTIYLPLDMQPNDVRGVNAHWIRCRLEPRADQKVYSQSPRIRQIRAFTLGGTVGATHAITVNDEALGVSTGEPGQVFTLRNTPILDLVEGETVEVEEKRDGDMVWTPWRRVKDISGSDEFERHFTLEMTTGEVRFGPAVRQPNGQVRQYGRVPYTGGQIRFKKYRYGGGVIGNVPVGKLQVLKSSIPYIDRVTNAYKAEGGRDSETLEEAKMRARREMRAQARAVTAEDYERLAKTATRTVARVKCNPPRRANALPPGMVELLVVPNVAQSVRQGLFHTLMLEPALQKQIDAHLSQFRLLTTTLRIREPRYLGIKVYAEVVPLEYVAPEAVVSRVQETLKDFLTPLVVEQLGEKLDELADKAAPADEGWEFGRNLFVAEVYALIQNVHGVKHVLSVRLAQRNIVPAEMIRSDGTLVEIGDDELTPVEQRMIEVPDDTLLCSLTHDIKVVSL